MGTPWTSVPPDKGLGSPDVVTLVDGTTFIVSPGSGDLSGDGAEGLFMSDTRVLTRWCLTLDGHRVEAISAVTDGPFSVSLVGRAVAEEHAESELAVIRRRHVGLGMHEDLELRYFGLVPRRVTVGLAVASDFASLFEVKAGHVAGMPTGAMSLEGRRLTVEPVGPAAVDALLVTFDRPPERLVDDRVEWDADLAPGEAFVLCAEVGVRVEGEVLDPSHRCDEPTDEERPARRLARWRASVPRVLTDDPGLARATTQAVDDLGALRIVDPNHLERVVVAAGAPWFMTLFGRDSLLTAWMALVVDHQLAQGVLASLADNQGRRYDPATEEEPGRILHEVRYDHHSARLLGGHNIYFGTVDATPLFVMLVAELARWTGATPAVEALLPAVDRAIAWIEECGDRDGDGFLEYARPRDTGLLNQGWKDSGDGIRYADGRIAVPPIALCEAQAYAHAAYRGRAELAELFGETETVARCAARAEAARVAFDERFWVPEHGWYAIGLDAEKRPIDSLTSNLGHCLWCGIVPDARSSRLAELLVSERMFTGWGLRTLAADVPGYNPLSYHCGSVWPHDTAIAIAGLARYGHDEAAGRLARGLIDAAAARGGRLPELFAGFDRADLVAPVPYPASCSPQAWAAASPLLVVRALLGLEPDVVHGVVRLRPRFPDGMSRLTVEGLPIAGQRVTVEATPSGVEVHGLPANLAVVVS